ncbi:NADPH-dependent ferric siderophore reductase [Ancylobacter sp. 3268]|uniref:siderophore-interacting protein n=1 Tax=Ancylobacter sp. 3268 TaxID=2817752 RepID=UPI002856D5AA|nr:siderophore-interacting protein [Ancylobacter sp. 3268]MDR6954987.1 NADPH-dependent ferric siderophore reductase [Ancylobacter sp. 3268]
MTERPLVALARVKLADPLGTAQALCAHFVAHGAVTRTPTGGVIDSLFGRAELRAEGAHLHLRAEGADATRLYVVRNALAEHLALLVGEDMPAFAWSGDAPIERAIPFFHAMHVAGTRQITPRMLRVTLAGVDVAAFESGAGLHVRLLIPPKGRAPVWPAAAPDGRTLWPKGADALARRVYTVRRVDRAAGSIDVDMVLHEDGCHPAPGSDWAAAARPGDPIGVMGPGGGLPPQADWYVLAGDETALPVIARIAEGLPSGCLVHALIEVADASEEQPIVSKADLRLSWLHRNGAPAGSTDLLERALRGIQWPTDGRGHVLAGCEHRTARAIRAFLVGARGMAKKDAHVAAYWRQGCSSDTAAEEQDRE